ncbi:MAG: hypothetical protein QY309_11415 [Cyclobacteriaceae bacterium]|nr:MAG: hypothetical protein QY309_11415 [Cyclobacteriaceae bacterium]
MRIIGEIPHPSCKITLFSWNNRYLIKLEQGLLEQTYKIDQFELSGEQELHQILSEEFLTKATNLFSEMEAALRKAQQAL